MASKNNHITLFVASMQHVYKFPTDPPKKPWTPPPAAAGHHGRYLWTDAFGVLNFLTLHRLTSKQLYLDHAKSLVAAVHNTLGRTRDLTSQLPGATPDNPLGGGLRIGKEDAVGSDCDGQYHHYLTLWMFALNRLSVESGIKGYNDHAICLARGIHPAFVYNRHDTRPRMYWKMSIDLQDPLVRSEGNLDPVDGLVIFKLLQRTDGEESRVLEEEIGDYQKIVDAKYTSYASSDPLDLGMTLWTAHWFDRADWARGLLDRAEQDTDRLWDSGYFKKSLRQRLAFRDFGLALGLQCGLAGREKWLERANSVVKSWEMTGYYNFKNNRPPAGVTPQPNELDGTGFEDVEADLLPITYVMYAAALIPGAFQKTAAE